MSLTFGYYDAWQNHPLTCDCGWSGPLSEDGTELYDALMDFECPRCDKILAIINYPTEDDIRRAAAVGHPDAVRQLASLDAGS